MFYLFIHRTSLFSYAQICTTSMKRKQPNKRLNGIYPNNGLFLHCVTSSFLFILPFVLLFSQHLSNICFHLLYISFFFFLAFLVFCLCSPIHPEKPHVFIPKACIASNPFLQILDYIFWSICDKATYLSFVFDSFYSLSFLFLSFFLFSFSLIFSSKRRKHTTSISTHISSG